MANLADLKISEVKLNTEETGKWGMVIDQDICTGCQACVAACAMENNVIFVGEEDAGYGRSMHWIRIERFWEGEYPEVKMTSNQPCFANSVVMPLVNRFALRLQPLTLSLSN